MTSPRSTRPTRPRLTPLAPEDWDDEQRAVLEPLASFRGRPMAIFATLARHPALLRRWLRFGNHVLFRSSLSHRDRELLILRTAWNCRAAYEWGHHVEIGLEAGLSAAEIDRIPAGADHPDWSETDRWLLTAADDLHADQCLAQPTWEALASHLSEHQLLDLVFAVGQYHLVSMALNSFGIQPEDGLPGLPEPPA